MRLETGLEKVRNFRIGTTSPASARRHPKHFTIWREYRPYNKEIHLKNIGKINGEVARGEFYYQGWLGYVKVEGLF